MMMFKYRAAGGNYFREANFAAKKCRNRRFVGSVDDGSCRTARARW